MEGNSDRWWQSPPDSLGNRSWPLSSIVVLCWVTRSADRLAVLLGLFPLSCIKLRQQSYKGTNKMWVQIGVILSQKIMDLVDLSWKPFINFITSRKYDIRSETKNEIRKNHGVQTGLKCVLFTFNNIVTDNYILALLHLIYKFLWSWCSVVFEPYWFLLSFVFWHSIPQLIRILHCSLGCSSNEPKLFFSSFRPLNTYNN